jgi:chemotaxis family two-component system response regulator Rcp1
VLAEIKADPKLRHIPVVIMTISNSEEDILNTYNLHVNCYITKPVDLDNFMNVFKSLEDFWLTVVRLPSR